MKSASGGLGMSTGERANLEEGSSDTKLVASTVAKVELSARRTVRLKAQKRRGSRKRRDPHDIAMTVASQPHGEWME